jgi:hypothetical protein
MMTRRMMMIALPALLALPATPAHASRSCGSITVQRTLHASIHVLHGRVSCREARSVLKTYGNGGGTRRGNRNGSRAEMYSVLPGGWRCKSGAGGEACTRGKRVGFTYAEEIDSTFR